MAVNDENQVSETFWLNIAAEQVYSTPANRNAAVERLQKTIVWVFGVYTSITVAGLLFAKSDAWNGWSLVFFGLAFFLLTVAYRVATMATFPVPESFYAEEAASVRDGFNKAISESNTRFEEAVGLCFTGVIFYSLAIFSLFASSALNRFTFSKAEKSNDDLRIELKKDPCSTHTYDVQILSAKNSWVGIRVLRGSTNQKDTIARDTLNIITNQRQKDLQVFVDSTQKIAFKLRVADTLKPVEYLVASRVDTLEQGGFIRVLTKTTKLF